MRAVRIIGKVLGWIALSALLLVVAVLLTVVIVGRTDWGHRKILAIALPEIQKQLAGHLQIGSIGGDLTHGLVAARRGDRRRRAPAGGEASSR